MHHYEDEPITPFGYLLLAAMGACLVLAGWYSYKSIDWDVLKRLEKTELKLPPPQNTPSNPTPAP